jgi:hypothetical protein
VQHGRAIGAAPLGTTRYRHLPLLVMLLIGGACAFAASPALAQDQGDGSGEDQPSLDELLDIGQQEADQTGDQPGEKQSPATQPDSEQPAGDQADPAGAENTADAQPPATQPGDGAALDPELEKLLQGRPKGDPFASAVSQMQTVARRLGDQRDPGRNTQRMQEQILKKLDQVLAQARRQQQQQQQQGGGQGQARRRQSGQNPAGRQQGQQGQQQGQQSSQTAQAGGQNPSGSSGEGGSTAASEAESLEALRRQWGNLPPRLRDELSEGLDEEFSPVYQSMTEEYYRRLAEQMREGQDQ